MKKKKIILTNKESQELVADSYKISRNGYTVIKSGDRYFYIRELG